jgi:hypothetical protein
MASNSKTSHPEPTFKHGMFPATRPLKFGIPLLFGIKENTVGSDCATEGSTSESRKVNEALFERSARVMVSIWPE